MLCIVALATCMYSFQSHTSEHTPHAQGFLPIVAAYRRCSSRLAVPAMCLRDAGSSGTPTRSAACAATWQLTAGPPASQAAFLHESQYHFTQQEPQAKQRELHQECPGPHILPSLFHCGPVRSKPLSLFSMYRSLDAFANGITRSSLQPRQGCELLRARERLRCFSPLLCPRLINVVGATLRKPDAALGCWRESSHPEETARVDRVTTAKLTSPSANSSP